ncbi:hypothetical protein B9Z55_007946 [Caenorhabditis nigoni]|uniref:SCP domain-containing protein n=1 Tax=Caenorhabditis nigoni TaxID=1611254 RepID=A0A2G5VC24_9PELO|nr:hypothetical protein B9Z55_007946 [Caenorhabditis nigoni]
MRILFFSFLIISLVSSDWTGPEFVEKLNEKRRDFAKSEKIPNMRELVWSLELALEVENRFENGTLVDGKDRYYTALDERDFEKHFNNFLKDVRHINRGFEGFYSINSRYLFPFVDKIGCNNEFENATYQYCYLNHGAPMNDLFLFFGAAGTRCDYGYENNNGLCNSQSSILCTIFNLCLSCIIFSPYFFLFNVHSCLFYYLKFPLTRIHDLFI